MTKWGSKHVSMHTEVALRPFRWTAAIVLGHKHQERIDLIMKVCLTQPPSSVFEKVVILWFPSVHLLQNVEFLLPTQHKLCLLVNTIIHLFPTSCKHSEWSHLYSHRVKMTRNNQHKIWKVDHHTGGVDESMTKVTCSRLHCFIVSLVFQSSQMRVLDAKYFFFLSRAQHCQHWSHAQLLLC